LKQRFNFGTKIINTKIRKMKECLIV